MGIADRDYMKEGDEGTQAPPLMERLNAFGERHSRLIIFLSTALIVVAVLVVADYMWRRSRLERGLAALEQATQLSDLEQLRKDFADHDLLLPRILYRLGNRYQEEAVGAAGEKARELLEKALKAYEEFRERFPNDALIDQVQRAWLQADENKVFLDGTRQALLKSSTLQTHPINRVNLKDNPIAWGPVVEPNPVVQVRLTEGRSFSIELYEDDAPNAVADFLELCGRKYFNQMKFTRVMKEEIPRLLTLQKKEKDPVTHLLALEKFEREVPEGAVAMIPTEDGSKLQAGVFEIMLDKKDTDWTGRTIIGVVLELQSARNAPTGQVIDEVMIMRKRDHEYESTKLEN